MLDLPAPAQALNIATAKPITTILAVFVPAEGILTTLGLRCPELVMYVPVARSITSVQTAVQPRPAPMQQPPLTTVEQGAIRGTLVRGIPTALQVDSMFGMVITTFCVVTVAQCKIINGARCTAM